MSNWLINLLIDRFLQDYAEEIEKLRAQVHRYRMELSNREGNFNRMFVDQRPVVVDRRAGRMSKVSAIYWREVDH